MKTALITGGSNGLGMEITKELLKRGFEVLNLDLKRPEHNHTIDIYSDSYYFGRADTTSKVQLEKAKEIAKMEFDKLDVVINNASVNHQDYLEDLDERDFDRVMEINVKGYYLVAKVFQEMLIDSEGTLLNVISDASHTPMTASLPYNASKGAQFIMNKQLARELTKRYNITVFGISPNKLKGTEMSDYIDETAAKIRGWTEEYAKEYQKKGLLTGEETDPKTIAEIVGFLLEKKSRHKFLSGCDLSFGN